MVIANGADFIKRHEAVGGEGNSDRQRVPGHEITHLLIHAIKNSRLEKNTLCLCPNALMILFTFSISIDSSKPRGLSCVIRRMAGRHRRLSLVKTPF
jgi:hypothetical protein